MKIMCQWVRLLRNKGFGLLEKIGEGWHAFNYWLGRSHVVGRERKTSRVFSRETEQTARPSRKDLEAKSGSEGCRQRQDDFCHKWMDERDCCKDQKREDREARTMLVPCSAIRRLIAVGAAVQQ